MLKSDDMTKLRIIAPSDKLKKIISALYNAKAIDIIEHKKNDELDIGCPLPGAEGISSAAVKVRSIIFQLGLKIDHTGNDEIKYLKTAMKQIDNLYETVSDATKRLKEVKQRLVILNNSKKMLREIESLAISLDLYHETKYVGYHIGTVTTMENLRQEIQKVSSNFELMSKMHNGKYLISIFFEKNKEAEILGILRNYSFNEIKLTEEFIGNKNAIKEIAKETSELDKEESRLKRLIAQTKKANRKDLLNWEEGLSVLAKKSDSPLMFAQTKNVSIISGWVPKKNLEDLKKKIQKITSNNSIVEELEIKKDDSVPIKLNNPGFAKPTEFFLRLFSLPSYKEIDPTLFMFFTFPLFFGFMLGDFGYGFFTLGLFWFLKIKLPEARDLLNIMIIASISTIAFGFVFGEAFGYEVGGMMSGEESNIEGIAGDAHAEEPVAHGETTAEHHVAPFPEWITTWPLHRSADNAINLIILTLIIGAVHVNFGLLLGFINVYRAHGLWLAILEKFSWVIVEIGLPIAILGLMGILPGWALYAGGGMVVLGGIMLFKGEGIQGVVELPSIFVHIGSYMRLMAIGLASVGLAIVINEQTGPLFSGGIVGIIGGILIFTIGHAINIALGIIGPFLHSIRLHYVEQFTKFYKGGGKEWKPFGL